MLNKIPGNMWKDFRYARNKMGRYHASIFSDNPETFCDVICTIQFNPKGYKTVYEAISACIDQVVIRLNQPQTQSTT